MSTTHKRTKRAVSRREREGQPSDTPAGFVNAEAFVRFQSIKEKSFIYERGFSHNVNKGGLVRKFWQTISQRGWATFCAPRKESLDSLVLEFYSNVSAPLVRETSIVMVRGKQIDLSPAAINAFYRTHDLPDADYDTLMRADQDFNPMLHRIITDQFVEWVSQTIFNSQGLTKESKGWWRFINASLLPSSHLSDLSKDRAIAIYCMLENKSLDIG